MVCGIPGRSPFMARVTVRIVMSVLSAIGSITLPTTVCNFHLRAIHPSRRSVMPAVMRRARAEVWWSCRIR